VTGGAAVAALLLAFVALIVAGTRGRDGATDDTEIAWALIYAELTPAVGRGPVDSNATAVGSPPAGRRVPGIRAAPGSPPAWS